MGLLFTNIGQIIVQEIDSTTNEFLIGPSVGLLRADIPPVATRVLGPSVVAADHFVNVRTSGRATQRYIRLLENHLAEVTLPIYEVLSDAFDLLVLFSMEKVERLPRNSSRNLVAGTHVRVRTDYTGTSMAPFDNGAAYGSARLLSINILDAHSRGVTAKVTTHEIAHQWAAFIDPALGLGDGVHYTNWSSVGSLVGGFLWNGTGPFTRNCDEGVNGAHRAPALDRYFMGIVSGSVVDPVHVSTSPPPLQCDEIISNYFSVAIGDIQARHGVRTPGPGVAPREFAIGFAAESHDRFLTSTEMTFYEILAEYYTREVPVADPDPYVGFNWVPISRYFGEEVSWRAYPVAVADNLARSRTISLQCAPNPSSGPVRIALTTAISDPRIAALRLEIYDAAGTHVRSLESSDVPHGFVYWDGGSEVGRPVARGVYFVRVSVAREEVVGKVVLFTPR